MDAQNRTSEVLLEVALVKAEQSISVNIIFDEFIDDFRGHTIDFTEPFPNLLGRPCPGVSGRHWAVGLPYCWRFALRWGTARPLRARGQALVGSPRSHTSS